MANAQRDENHVTTMLGVLNTDGTTPTLVKANATNHTIDTHDNTSGSDFGGDVGVKDENHVTSLMAVSSADGVTPVLLYVNSSGELMIDSS